MKPQQSLLARLTLWFIFLLSFGTLLIITRNFLYPIAIAALFAYLLFPVCNFLEKRGLPRILSNLISIILLIVVVGFLISIISQKLSIFMDKMPLMQEKATESIKSLETYLNHKFSKPSNDHWLQNKIYFLLTSSGTFVSNAVKGTTGTILKIGLIPVYLFFLLYYRDKFKTFICKLLPVNKHKKADEVIGDISLIMRKYMAGIVTVVLILCVLNSVGLMIIGVEYAVLFGVLSAMLNFIPYFGTLAGGLIPLTYVLLIQGSPHNALMVVVLYLIIQFIDHNILTPNITGGNVQVNPFFTILSIITGGMLWGIPGMIVSVPAMAVIKILCENIETMRPYAYLLGTKGTMRHALTWEKLKTVFSGRKKSRENTNK